MPRKTCAKSGHIIIHQFGFNEAAARCRGKPWLAGPGAYERPRASMRPRPDAAENAISMVTRSPSFGLLQ